jgi:hypothetical protein
MPGSPFLPDPVAVSHFPPLFVETDVCQPRGVDTLKDVVIDCGVGSLLSPTVAVKVTGVLTNR